MSSPSDEDDRTVWQSSSQAVTTGSDSRRRPDSTQAAGDGAAGDGHGLRSGSRLGEFELTRRIGEGGFSIVYLAWDHSLERRVALKEYMPTSIAARVGDTQVAPRSERHRDTFELGLKSFINEGKLLAQFDHPALVKVYRFWEANGTAYMVMPYYEGVTLKDAVRAMARPPNEAWLLELLAPLTDALCVIHKEHCYHRDIAPDNVMLLAGSGKPLLLDFGAARRVIGDMTHALTVILKPGYAPVEQYADVPGMTQGPWTDVYALGAVVYWVITGRTPPPSVGRMMRDSHVPLLDCAADRYSQGFLRAIDRALVVLPEARTQTIEAFRRDLGLTPQADPSPRRPVAWDDADATVIRPGGPGGHVTGMDQGGDSNRSSANRATDAQAATAAGPSAASHSAPSARQLRFDADAADTRTVQQPTPPIGHLDGAAIAAASEARARRWPVLLAWTIVGAIALSAGLWWLLEKPTAEPAASALQPSQTDTRPAPVPATAPEVSLTTPAPVAASQPATAPAPAPEPTEQQNAAPAATQAPLKKPAPSIQKAERPKTERRSNQSANDDECARVLERLSLGESSQELLERAKTMNCR